MTPLLVAAPLILAAVLVTAAIGKLRHPEDADAWAELGVPPMLRQRWLIGLHPWAEIALAAALLVLGGPLGALAAAAAVLLFSAYLALVVRARLADSGAACSCFGAREPITAGTVMRNAWYVLLAVATAGSSWTTPLLGGPLAALDGEWPWVLALAAAAVTVWLSMRRASAQPSPPAGVPIVGRETSSTDSSAAPDEGDYVRRRTPAVPVQLADGRTVNLRELAARGPILLLAVTEGCLACDAVIRGVAGWRVLLPELSIRLLLWPAPSQSTLTERDEPQSLHDPYQYVRGSIDDWATPAAVPIGADGYLAGGPVSGADDIESFIGDIYESLHGERPPREA